MISAKILFNHLLGLIVLSDGILEWSKFFKDCSFCLETLDMKVDLTQVKLA